MNTKLSKKTIFTGAIVYNAYIEGLTKGGQTQKALQIFDKMKRDRCQPTADTYTMIINLYGKVKIFFSISILFLKKWSYVVFFFKFASMFLISG